MWRGEAAPAPPSGAGPRVGPRGRAPLCMVHGAHGEGFALCPLLSQTGSMAMQRHCFCRGLGRSGSRPSEDTAVRAGGSCYELSAILITMLTCDLDFSEWTLTMKMAKVPANFQGEVSLRSLDLRKPIAGCHRMGTCTDLDVSCHRHSRCL